MGLFTRRGHEAHDIGPHTGPGGVEPTQPALAHHDNNHHHEQPGHHGMFGGRQERRTNRKLSRQSQRNRTNRSRPTFGQWIKGTWLDVLTMIALGAIGLGVYQADPAPSRSFPVVFQDGEIVYPQFGYPLRNEIIPIWAAALLAVLIPIVVILFCQIRVRSFWDVNNGVMGLLYSVITAAVFQVFIKWLIGGLRPHFLAVCDPAVSFTGEQIGNGLRSIYYDRSICRGDRNKINDALESFPSGHSTAAFAGFVYLYLYLNAKLKVFANYHPAMWKLVVLYAPILGAVLIAGVLTIDEYHNWYDCLAGAVVGTLMAFSAYRMVYASIWDWRTNHMPLTRNGPFSYENSHSGASAMWTRKAGWGGGHQRAHGTVHGSAPLPGRHGGHETANHHTTDRHSYQSDAPIGGMRNDGMGDTGHTRHSYESAHGQDPLSNVTHVNSHNYQNRVSRRPVGGTGGHHHPHGTV
ncbi:MAG: WD40 repeat-like protein [Vezdaea aestivalis]|nr:MAG: WD40 repeat-like protein [Vezdaea aestivalis]